MKKVLLDSSSAIILEKSDLIDLLFDVYSVILTESVYHELTQNSYPSARLFERHYSEASFALCPASNASSMELTADLQTLNPGERETIMQFETGTGDFIVVDDGKAAKYCFRNNLPFINTLLFPIIMYISGRFSKWEKESSVSKILNIGYYSQKIIDQAGSLSIDELKPFLP